MQTVKQGMTLADAVIVSAGSMEDFFAFCMLNKLAYTDDAVAGQTLQDTGIQYQKNNIPDNDHIIIKPVVTLFNQTLMDMAVQQLGSIEAFFALAMLNGMAFSDDLEAGAQLNYSITPYNKAMLKIYQDNGYKPATGDMQPGQLQTPQPDGIGYWIIGYDFIVS